MEIVGNDGRHVGTVDHVENGERAAECVTSSRSLTSNMSMIACI